MVVRTRELVNGRVELSPDLLEGDLIQPGHRLFGLVWVNPQRMHGEPCFAGSRVPVKTLFEYIEGGDPIDTFLEHFPPIPREQVVAVLEAAREGMLKGLEPD
jgi:uncharacterized protein (DUF433 family)